MGGFRIKTSKSLQINSGFQTKSLLAKTLNKNSALVNLNNRSQFEQINKGSLHSHSSHQNVNKKMEPKTFNPPKQWLDGLKMDQNKKLYAKHSPIKIRKSPNHQKNLAKTLTVGNHTFSGIWARTSM